MCGRTACTLAPDDVCHACAYKDSKNQWQLPDWKDSPDGRQYYQSYNVSPTSCTPVMFSKKHVSQDCNDTERVIQPMYWGLVPFWHKGELSKVGLSTNNARSETMLSKSLFSVPLKKGNRCVILADGYYEWQTKENSREKQPYFIYFPQADGIKIEDNSSWKDGHKLKEENGSGWSGPRLLTMAGIFDVWSDPSDSSNVYSYAVITLEASPLVSFIHERMPAILDGEEAIQRWLDFGNVDLQQAVKLISASSNLTYHPVTQSVGNSRYKSPDCLKPIDLNSKKLSKSGNLMMNWLKKANPSSCTRPSNDSNNNSDSPDIKSTSHKRSRSPELKNVKKEKR